MACAWKDLNKSVKDCLDVGSSSEMKMKFVSKSSDGTSFESTQVKRHEDVGKDKSGHFGTFLTKFPKASAGWLNEVQVNFNSPESGKLSYDCVSKWSMNTKKLMPDTKVKVKVNHDLSALCPKKLNTSVHYNRGNVVGSAGLTTSFGSTLAYNADVCTHTHGVTVGACVTGTQDGSKPLDANLALKYSKCKWSVLLQTAKMASVVNASVYQKCSPKFHVCSKTTLSNMSSNVQAKQVFGMLYNVDADSKAQVSVDMGDVSSFDVSKVNVSALYSTPITSSVRLNLSGSVTVGETDYPKFGMNIVMG